MSWLNIDLAATTVVSETPVFLDRIIIGGGTTGAVTLYNAATADGAEKLLVMAPDQGSEDKLRPYNFDLMVDALTIVTAAATDMLVIYYDRDKDGGVPTR